MAQAVVTSGESSPVVAHEEPHKTNTGVSNNKLGMWVFIAQEVMFFGGMLTAYLIYRLWFYAGYTAASRELDQRSRIGFLRSMPDRARPLVQLGLTSLGRESALIGAAGLARLALRQAPRTKSAG